MFNCFELWQNFIVNIQGSVVLWMILIKGMSIIKEKTTTGTSITMDQVDKILKLPQWGDHILTNMSSIKTINWKNIKDMKDGEMQNRRHKEREYLEKENMGQLRKEWRCRGIRKEQWWQMVE